MCYVIRTAVGIFLLILKEIFVSFDFYNLTLIFSNSKQLPWALFLFLKSLFESSTYLTDVTLVLIFVFTHVEDTRYMTGVEKRHAVQK